MADGGDGGKAVAVNPQFAIEGPIFQSMEDSLEKLKVLDYETRYCQPKRRTPFDRTYFALPGKNPSVQLQNFLDIVAWLIYEATGDDNLFKIDKFDDPNTSANKLVLALRNLNFSLDFPVAKLKQAHGEAVCSVLDFLCQKALDKRGFTWQRPVYREEVEAEEAEVDDEADVADVVDEAAEQEEEEAIFSEVARGGKEEAEKLDADRKVLESSVDPIKWKTELERVSSRLKAPQSIGGKEWREHIEQTHRNEETIQKVFSETKSQLQAMADDVSSALERLTSKEKYINHQFDALRQEYAALKQELKDVEVKYQEVNGRVGSLTNELSAISDRLEEIKDITKDRGESMSDTSPLVKIRLALQSIKAEIQAFDLRCGVVSHTLLHARIRSDKQSRITKNKHKHQHHHHHKHGSNATEIEADLSDPDS